MRTRILSAVFGAVALGLLAGGAQAVPSPKALDGVAATPAVDQVNYRYYRPYYRYRYYRPYYRYRYYRPYYYRHYYRPFFFRHYYRPYYRHRFYRRSWW